jgi:hypothetical protein
MVKQVPIHSISLATWQVAKHILVIESWTQKADGGFLLALGASGGRATLHFAENTQRTISLAQSGVKDPI